MIKSRSFRRLGVVALLLGFFATAWGGGGSGASGLPPAILAIMQKPRYSGATWGLRVTDLKSGAVIYDLNSKGRLLTGSVRKLFSVGVTLNELGPDHRFKTPVFRRGEVDAAGTLNGD